MEKQKKSANEVLAEALKFFKGDKWTNVSLAQAAGIGEATIRNYLSPTKRATGKSGKEPSAKLTELDKLAEVLGVDAADLIADMTDAERLARHRQHAANYYTKHGRLPSWAPDSGPHAPTAPAARPGAFRAPELGSSETLASPSRKQGRRAA